MKALYINYELYYYPPEIDTIEKFVDFLQRNYNSFIPLTHLIEEKCVAPYFIKDKVETVYLNVAQINEISELEITVLTQKEYNKRLKEVVASKCVRCKNYIDDDGDDCDGNSDKINLDGKCPFFEEAVN